MASKAVKMWVLVVKNSGNVVRDYAGSTGFVTRDALKACFNDPSTSKYLRSNKHEIRKIEVLT